MSSHVPAGTQPPTLEWWKFSEMKASSLFLYSFALPSEAMKLVHVGGFLILVYPFVLKEIL